MTANAPTLSFYFRANKRDKRRHIAVSRATCYEFLFVSYHISPVALRKEHCRLYFPRSQRSHVKISRNRALGALVSSDSSHGLTQCRPRVRLTIYFLLLQLI